MGEEIPELRALQLEKILEQKNVVKQKGLTHV